MINEPIYKGRLQSDLDFAGFNPVNLTGWPPTGGGGTSSPQTLNIKNAPYNAAGNGVTDDTAAIQAAINYLTANGGGTIFFPDEGPYIIAGPLLDPSRRNSQLLLPVIPVEDSRQFAITFEGYCPLGVCTGSSYRIPMPNGTRIKSTLATGTGTQPSVMCGMGPVGGAYGETTNLHVGLKNLIWETVANPSYSGLNLRNVMDVSTENILVIAGEYFDTIRMTEPMTSTSYGIILPDQTRGEFMHLKGNLNVFGFYNGIGWAELATADMVSCLACKVGLVVPGAPHPSLIGRLLVWFCTKGMVVVPGTGIGTQHRMTLLQYDSETGPNGFWYRNVLDIDDPSNVLVGDTNYIIWDSSAGAERIPMAVTGCSNFIRRRIGQAGMTVAQLPTNPVLGQTFAVTDGVPGIAWGTLIVSGGSTKYQVWWNGLAWTVIGK